MAIGFRNCMGLGCLNHIHNDDVMVPSHCRLQGALCRILAFNILEVYVTEIWAVL